MSNDPIRILLVDDDAETRDVYIQFLQKTGFVVEEAENGLEALQRIQDVKPDLIITGIIMPRMDGFTLVQALRQNIDTAQIPVIFLSHLGRQEDQHRSKELGVDDFIVRDITPLKEVVARIRALLTATEYIIAIEPGSFDAKRFAADMGLPENFASSEGVNSRYVLRLRPTDATSQRFDGEIIST
ncbi:MAG: response regulator [Candidatus Moraniibacteriota bacterium]